MVFEDNRIVSQRPLHFNTCKACIEHLNTCEACFEHLNSFDLHSIKKYAKLFLGLKQEQKGTGAQ